MKSAKPLLIAISALLLGACSSTPERPQSNPQWRHSDPLHFYYDGQADDLLTAGLGIEGLRGQPPLPADAAHPTRSELRRLTYYNNYRAIVDTTETGGFTRLYGPADHQLPVPGHEYWALGHAPDGTTHTVLLQVPDTFPGNQPCLVAAPSSGSRGVLGAIGSAGDWGLRRGCAVVYTDKGAGPALSGFNSDQLMDITGQWGSEDSLATVEPFTRTYQNAAPESPPAVAVKHAHSTKNPERLWGELTLHAIRYGIEVLNEHHPRTHGVWSGDRLKVIAASVSNGGGSVLQAGEADTSGLIDGIVASEPNIWPGGHFELHEGGAPPTMIETLPLFDFATAAWLYEACATAGPDFGSAPMAIGQMQLLGLLGNRCLGLVNAGLIEGDELVSRSRSAQAALLASGLHAEAADAQPLNTILNLWGLVATVYAPAYARVQYPQPVCDTAFHAFDAAGSAVAPDHAALQTLFAVSAGVPPVIGIEPAVVSDDGPVKMILSPSKWTDGQPAYGLDAALCARRFTTHPNEGLGPRVRQGIEQTRASADLHGIPTVVLHGRSDALVWVNHTSRAYLVAHEQRARQRSLSYIEVVNAQHFDTALSFVDVGARFVPLHYYFEQALERLWAHLTEDQPLPPSQVISARPRGKQEGQVPALEVANLPPIRDNAGEHVIEVQGNRLRIPQ